jgi:hypothetical protein
LCEIQYIVAVHTCTCCAIEYNNISVQIQNERACQAPGQGQLQRPIRPDVTLVRILIGCVLVGVVTESKICRAYKTALQTIKVAVHNSSGASNFIA